VTDDPLKAIACSLHDSVMVLAPGGWTEVDLTLHATDRGLRLTSLSSKGEGARAPKPKPDLGIPKEHEALRLSDGLDELSHLLAEEGRHWHGGSARLERGADATDLKLLGEADRPVWFTRLERDELDQLLVTDALFEALTGTEAAFGLLQGALQADAGAALTELGRYQLDDYLWSWNHGEPDVRRLCGVETQPPGLSAFFRPRFACDEGFAWALCAHLVVSLGARGLQRVAQGRTVTLCAVRATSSSGPPPA
jgi:hypothetical protein